MIVKHQLRWSGHLVRMNDDRLPKQLFYGQLDGSKRNPGGQKLRYKDVLKNNLKACKIDPNNWEVKAGERSSWRTAIHAGSSKFETERLDHAIAKRAGRKERQAARAAGTAPPAPTGSVCQVCGFVARARIGLIGHMRKHRTN